MGWLILCLSDTNTNSAFIYIYSATLHMFLCVLTIFTLFYGPVHSNCHFNFPRSVQLNYYLLDAVTLFVPHAFAVQPDTILYVADV